MKLRVILLGAALSVPAHAADITDVYGAEGKEAAKVVKKYAKRATEIEVSRLSEGMLKTNPDYKVIEHLELEKMALLKSIMREGGFAYAAVEMITYPNDTNHYVTIDVVKKNEQRRLRFVSPIFKGEKYPERHDIIEKMQDFTRVQLQLMLRTNIQPGGECPVYHCVSTFDNPKLKPYLFLFNKGAIQEKQLILDTLKQDANPQRRAAAAFLVGHFKDPQEIISVLSKYVEDKDEVVRNNVMRVIGATMLKSHINTVDAAPFLELLDSPSVTDRNKSLFVLYSIADSQAGKQFMLREGRQRLLAVLKLKQPNNHDFAYRIIKKLSGQDFGEYNIAAWNAWWINAQKNRVTKTA